MKITGRAMLSRWGGLSVVATLLAVCLALLGGQVARSEPESPPKLVTTSSAGSITDTHILLQKNDGYYDAAGVAITQVTSYYFGQDEAWVRYQAGSLDTIAPARSGVAGDPGQLGLQPPAACLPAGKHVPLRLLHRRAPLRQPAGAGGTGVGHRPGARDRRGPQRRRAAGADLDAARARRVRRRVRRRHRPPLFADPGSRASWPPPATPALPRSR